MSSTPKPLDQVHFNQALDTFIAEESLHRDTWGCLGAVVNPEFGNPTMLDAYQRYLHTQCRRAAFVIVLDLATPEAVNKNMQWLLNQLGSQTPVFPARKNYRYDDVVGGFLHTELLVLYHIDTLRNKRGQIQDGSLELLLSIFRNEHLARVLIPNNEPTWEAIGHHRLAAAFRRVDLNLYV